MWHNGGSGMTAADEVALFTEFFHCISFYNRMYIHFALLQNDVQMFFFSSLSELRTSCFHSNSEISEIADEANISQGVSATS